jgi:hypothetical protein
MTNWEVFIASKYAANAETTQYTSPPSVRSNIDKFTATNVSAAVAQTVYDFYHAGG